MCKKLMFLISLVSLLVMVNGVSADEIDWTGAGPTDSFCDPCNWDGDVVPGSGDRARIDTPPERGPIIDCDVEVERIEGPGRDESGDQVMDIVSGTILINTSEDDSKWEWGREEGTVTVNFSGTPHITIRNEWRWGDNGDGLYTANMFGSPTMVVTEGGDEDGRVRWADSGTCIWNIGDPEDPCSSPTVTCVYMRFGDNDDAYGTINMNSGLLNCTGEDDGYSVTIGDDGFGTINVNGGTMALAFGISLSCREKGQDVVNTFNMDGGLVTIGEGGFATLAEEEDGHTGTAYVNVSGGEMYIGGDMELCKEGDGATFVTMTGGYVEASGSIIAPDNDDCEATITLSGGTLKATETLAVQENGTATLLGGTLQADRLQVDEDGFVKLNGGTAELGDLDIEDGGLVDFRAGSVMIIDGDARDLIAEYIDAGKWATNAGRNDPDIVYNDVEDKTTITAPPVNWFQAWGPVPRNGAEYYTILDMCCKWKAGNGAYAHIVMFDESFDDVNDADPTTAPSWEVPPFRGMYPTGQYCPASPIGSAVPVTLELFKTYYWRVDEMWWYPPRPPGAGIERGIVWSFSTGCDLPEDFNGDCMVNFKDYADIGAEWQDKVYWPPE